MEQLDDNLGALEREFFPKNILKALEEVSPPKLNFPYDFVRNSAPFSNGGTTINKISAAAIPIFPQNDADRY